MLLYCTSSYWLSQLSHNSILTDGETEARGCSVIYSRTHNKKVVEMGFEFRSVIDQQLPLVSHPLNPYSTVKGEKEPLNIYIFSSRLLCDQDD